MSRAGPRKTPAELLRRRRKPGAEPQPHVIGDPQPGLVPQDWLEEVADLLPRRAAVVRGKGVRKSSANSSRQASQPASIGGRRGMIAISSHAKPAASSFL